MHANAVASLAMERQGARVPHRLPTI